MAKPKAAFNPEDFDGDAGGPLFDAAAKSRARGTDPETSKDAAAYITGSRAAAQSAALVALVETAPGRTTQELAALHAGLTRSQISRRAGELRDVGRLVAGPARRCAVTGRNATTWDVPQAGGQTHADRVAELAKGGE